MSVYVIPTVPTFYLGEILDNERPSWLEVMYPAVHKKSHAYELSGGERYCRLPLIRNLGGQQVEVLHTGYSSRFDVDQGLEYLRQTALILSNPMSKRGKKLEPPKHLRLHLTSFPYAKQDFVWEYGEVNRAKFLIEELLAHFHSIDVIAPHFTTKGWARELSREGRVRYITTPYRMLHDRIIADYPKEKFVFISPGKFARTGFKTVRTRRTDGMDVEIVDEMLRQKYEKKNVAVIDDITLTGTTALDFAKALRRLEVSKLILGLVHIGTEAALDKLLESGYDTIYTTNSCGVFSPKHLANSKLKVLSMIPYLIDVMGPIEL